MNDLPKNSEFVGILLAAGRGNRFDRKIPKQFFSLNKNKQTKSTVLEESFKTLLLFSHKIILVLPKFYSEEKELINLSAQITHKLELLAKKRGVKLKVIVGGKTRLASVKSAAKYLLEREKEKKEEKKEEEQYILIHDAARCFCHFRDIRNLQEKVREKKAVILAKRATDTIKIVSNVIKNENLEKDLEIVNTLPRVKTWHAQTPQAFQLKLFLESLEALEALENFSDEISDDASILEIVGQKVYLLESKYSKNQKVTYREDL